MAASVRATELVGRHLGIKFMERKDITITPGADRPLREYTLEQLEAIA